MGHGCMTSGARKGSMETRNTVIYCMVKFPHNKQIFKKGYVDQKFLSLCSSATLKIYLVAISIQGLVHQ